MTKTIPEWYWKSETHQKILQEHREWFKDHPCHCFGNDDPDDNQPYCICVDGETCVDFCNEHGGYGDITDCVCCVELSKKYDKN